MNTGILGVAAEVGAAILLFRAPVRENVWLNGVPIETSEPSGLETDRFRCFKLREDLFFLIPRVALLNVFGEPGASVVSFDIVRLSGGADEVVKVVSAGLGATGSGEGALRPVGGGAIVACF